MVHVRPSLPLSVDVRGIAPDPDTVPRTLFMGSYPPRECGIATFTADIVNNFDLLFARGSEVIAIEEPGGEGRVYPSAVIARLRQDDRESYAEVAAIVDAHPAEVLNIQHEYGLFGGEHGEWLLELMERVSKPIVVSMHTILPEPEDHFKLVTQRMCTRANAVICLSLTGKQLLADVYGVDESKIRVIHHGVPDVPFRTTEAAKGLLGVAGRKVIMTFGLISRGKGLEFAIDAMAEVVKKHPDALYLILGETHPGVRRHEGESYRESLHERVATLGLENNVKLVNKYLEFDELVNYLEATDIYLTPYLNPVQIVSGTLAYAVGCGKAIVSTPYLYAKELLAHHRGFLVDFRDSEALANAVIALFDNPALRRAVERRAYRFGRRMTWPFVVSEYAKVFCEFAASTRRRELVRLT